MKFMKLSKMKFPSPLLIRLSDLFINVTSWRRGLSSRFYENKRRYDDDLLTQTKVRSVDQYIRREQVTRFVYLGGLITEDGRCEEDVKRRIGLACAAFGGLGKMWREKSISIATKMKLYYALVV